MASARSHCSGDAALPSHLCEPAKKINSGYKASEYLIYLWMLGPAVFRVVLPLPLWVHFCKLVHGIRVVLQCQITHQQIVTAHRMLNEWEMEFEEIYYA